MADSGGERSRSRATLDGDRIRELRERLGFTQDVLAREAGLTARTVQAAEAGRRVDAESARRLARGLAVPLARLVVIDRGWREQRLAECGCAPPRPPAHWTGRSAERARLQELLTPSSQGIRVAVTGLAGIGKSSLASVVAGDVAQSWADGVAWIAPSRGWYGVGLPLAHALGFAGRLPNPLQVGPAAWEQAFMAHLWGRRVLVVLDEVQDVEILERFLGTVGLEPRLLVTTSSRFVAESLGGEVLQVGPMPEEEGLDLLALQLGEDRVRRDETAMRRLVADLGGVPRGLQLAARSLRRDPWKTADQYLEEIGTATAPLAPMAWLDILPPEDETLRQTMRQLGGEWSAKTRAAFAALSAIGGVTFNRRWACAATGLSEPDLNVAVSQIADAFLMQETEWRSGPAFRLDSQSQRAAAALLGGDDGPARRLQEAALVRAGWLSDLEPIEALHELSEERGVWSTLLRTLGSPSAASTTGVPRDSDRTGAGEANDGEPVDTLGGLLTRLGRLLLHVLPEETTAALVVGIARSQKVGDDRAAGSLAQLVGNARAQSLDFDAARRWHLDAAHTLERAGLSIPAALSMVDVGRMEFVGLDASAAALSLARAHQLLLLAPSEEATPLVAAVEIALAVVSLHAPGGGDWEAADRNLLGALERLRDVPGDYAAFARDVATVNRALVARLGLGAAPPPGTDAALARLATYVASDDLDRFRLAGLARTLGLAVPGGEPLPPLDEILVNCPEELFGRRIIRLHELLTALALHHAVIPQPARMSLLAHGTTTTDLVYAQPYAASDLAPPLMCPFGPFLEAWTPAVKRSCEAFLSHALGAGHPLAHLASMCG